MPFFTYYKTDTLNRLVPIPKTQLPLYHGIIHGAVNDTGKFALTDSIRAVRVHFLTAARDPRTGTDALRTVETLVRLMNSGLLDRTSCGQPPYPDAVPHGGVEPRRGAPEVRHGHVGPKSVDDGAGEKDIERYAIFRRLSGATAFGDPISSIPGVDGGHLLVHPITALFQVRRTCTASPRRTARRCSRPWQRPSAITVIP